MSTPAHVTREDMAIALDAAEYRRLADLETGTTKDGTQVLHEGRPVVIYPPAAFLAAVERRIRAKEWDTSGRITREQMATALDAILQRILTEGVPVLDSDGYIILSNDKPIMTHPPAAVMSVAERRIKAKEKDKASRGGIDPVAAARMAEQARRSGKALPPVRKDRDGRL